MVNSFGLKKSKQLPNGGNNKTIIIILYMDQKYTSCGKKILCQLFINNILTKCKVYNPTAN